jgi:hypothetical protein
MIPVEAIPGMRGRRDKGEQCRGVKSSMIYLIHCMNFCKCHSVPPPSTIIKKFSCLIISKLYMVERN